ncbi:MAG: PepSY domain-containing protein [Thiohalomonadaceae bacterium]
MKKSPILAIVLGTAVVTGTAFAASDGNAAMRPSNRTDTWLTIPAIHEKVVAAGYSDITEIERDKGVYEIKAVNADGERVKLYVDPLNGEVLEARVKRDKRASRNQRDARWSDERRRDRSDD